MIFNFIMGIKKKLKQVKRGLYLLASGGSGGCGVSSGSGSSNSGTW